MATLVYDICKGSLPKSNQNKFQQYFANKVVKNLEKNMIKILDPESTEPSRFQKIDYKLPKEIQEAMVNEDERDENVQWTNVMNKVNLANV